MFVSARGFSRTARGWLAVAAVALVVAAVAAAWALAGRELASPKAVTPDEPASSLVWGDRVFSERAGFAQWLRSRDHSYARWAQLHPAGRKVFGPRRDR